jgi:hypothetical protein
MEERRDAGEHKKSGFAHGTRCGCKYYLWALASAKPEPGPSRGRN